MTAPVQLPMALADCSLDDTALRDQLARYRRLGSAAATMTRSETELTVAFATGADAELVRATMAVERQCCSFFTLAYDDAERQLTIGVSDPTRRPALDAIERALRCAQ
jgi:hypothetical protein